MCKTEQETQELIAKMKQENSHFSEESIRRAIELCCKNQKEDSTDTDFEECVLMLSNNEHLINYSGDN